MKARSPEHFQSSAARRSALFLGSTTNTSIFALSSNPLKSMPERSQIAVTTLVRPHNLLGRTYLAGVLPFHRIIVPAMLVQAAQA